VSTVLMLLQLWMLLRLWMLRMLRMLPALAALVLLAVVLVLSRSKSAAGVWLKLGPAVLQTSTSALVNVARARAAAAAATQRPASGVEMASAKTSMPGAPAFSPSRRWEAEEQAAAAALAALAAQSMTSTAAVLLHAKPTVVRSSGVATKRDYRERRRSRRKSQPGRGRSRGLVRQRHPEEGC
jgi:hypothetical protein